MFPNVLECKLDRREILAICIPNVTRPGVPYRIMRWGQIEDGKPGWVGYLGVEDNRTAAEERSLGKDRLN